eukprot:SAG11_NODE_3477_length_2424_cov_2.073548_1_plen_370_part_00
MKAEKETEKEASSAAAVAEVWALVAEQEAAAVAEVAHAEADKEASTVAAEVAATEEAKAEKAASRVAAEHTAAAAADAAHVELETAALEAEQETTEAVAAAAAAAEEEEAEAKEVAEETEAEKEVSAAVRDAAVPKTVTATKATRAGSIERESALGNVAFERLVPGTSFDAYSYAETTSSGGPETIACGDRISVRTRHESHTPCSTAGDQTTARLEALLLMGAVKAHVEDAAAAEAAANGSKAMAGGRLRIRHTVRPVELVLAKQGLQLCVGGYFVRCYGYASIKSLTRQGDSSWLSVSIDRGMRECTVELPQMRRVQFEQIKQQLLERAPRLDSQSKASAGIYNSPLETSAVHAVLVALRTVRHVYEC